MQVKNIMTKTKAALKPEASAIEAWNIMNDTKLPGIPVIDKHSHVTGIVAKDEIVSAGPRILAGDVSVQSVMRADVPVLREDAPVSDAWTMPANVFPVVNGKGRITGVLDRSDVGRVLFMEASRLFQKIETIMDSAHNGIVAIDENGIVTMFNQAAEKITRRKNNEALGRHLSEVIVPQGLLDVLKEGQYQSHYKFTVAYSSGTHTYLTNRTPIIENGRVVGAIGVFQDISEFEFISEELNTVKQLNKELEAIIESSYDGIIITDHDGKIIRANRANERITGVSRRELQEMAIRDLVNRGVFTNSMVESVVAKGEAVTISEQTAGQNHLLLTGSPVVNQQGEIARVVINIRDMKDLNNLKNRLEESLALSERYHDELTQLRSKFMAQEGVVIKSAGMKAVMNVALRLARVDSTALLLGESGVGKEVVAKAIHRQSKRSKGPFITVNCGAIPENLLESELFGYDKGAFTGASSEGKPGMFELADKGTLFLDEVGDLPPSFQVKLLRAIQEKEITRVGGVRPLSVNVRIIAATNKRLKELVQQGKFREDLYFRLNVVPIRIPPLRERKDDIIPLVYLFKKQFEKTYELDKEFSPSTYQTLQNHSWPGNVREIKNVVERLLVTAPGRLVDISEIPGDTTPQSRPAPSGVSVSGIIPLKKAQIELERQLIGAALKELGSTHKAAKALHVDQSTIVRKMNRIREEGLNI
ncbi:MAG: sigma 54-interacting transcriptional regulator [Firmicutes bacterium]|nr:sigma 54-interacting transcriptional regulator [Bacillota bacterium]